MNEDRNRKSIKILKNCLNKELKNIYVTGYSEVKDEFNFFSPMNWWYYLEFADCFLCIESSQTTGVIELHIHQNIQCNFDIEKVDIFTVAMINNENYLGKKIVAFDLIYGTFDPGLFALGLQFEDRRYAYQNNKYVYFNSLNFDGIEVGDKSNRDELLEDKRFYLEKLG